MVELCPRGGHPPQRPPPGSAPANFTYIRLSELFNLKFIILSNEYICCTELTVTIYE